MMCGITTFFMGGKIINGPNFFNDKNRRQSRRAACKEVVIVALLAFESSVDCFLKKPMSAREILQF